VGLVARYRQPVDAAGDVVRPLKITAERLHKMMFWPPGAEPIVLQALDMWSTRGDSGESDSWRVIMNAIAESGMSSPPFEADRGKSDELVRVWLRKHCVELESLKRCWRVEAARADLLELWESIDGNNVPYQLFRQRYDTWSQASTEAAEAAVAAWLGKGPKTNPT
jgi:hypothetical protein